MNTRQRTVVVIGVTVAVILLLLPPWRTSWTVVTRWGESPPPPANRRIVEEPETRTQVVRSFLFTGPQPPPEKERAIPALARVTNVEKGKIEVVVGVENRGFQRSVVVWRLLLELAAVIGLAALLCWANRDRKNPRAR